MKIAIAYLILVWINWGLAFADQQYHSRQAGIDKEWYRSDLSFSLFFALFPPLWICLLFFTGFYEHGWRNPLVRPK